MTLSKILNQTKKQASFSKKVTQIKEVVGSARKSYGNTSMEIRAERVNTCNGSSSIKYLSDEDKVALVTIEVDSIRQQAIAKVECAPGILFDKTVVELIATNPILCNLGESVTSEFI